MSDRAAEGIWPVAVLLNSITEERSIQSHVFERSLGSVSFNSPATEKLGDFLTHFKSEFDESVTVLRRQISFFLSDNQNLGMSVSLD